MFEDLQKQSLASNLELFERGLVPSTFGNVSVFDRNRNAVAIKPSGISYQKMSVDDIVVVDLSGEVLIGKRRPSSDMLTHVQFYRDFPELGSIVHTHSEYATIWAQAGMSIPPLGTTHADYFNDAIPVTRNLTDAEIKADYLRNTAKVIVETINHDDIYGVPAVLVRAHGPFCWGKNGQEAVNNADMLELTAKMAFKTLQLNRDVEPIGQTLHNLHFQRKHGRDATYGQPKK